MKLVQTMAFCLAVAMAAGAAIAAEDAAPSKPAAKPELEVIELAVHPAQAPRPALAWCLLPSYTERTPGNAAVVYAKACTWLGVSFGGEDGDRVREWLETPVESLPREEVRKLLEGYDEQLRYVDMAARRERCDWDPPVREEGRNVFGMLLPEVQAIRWAARLVALRARLQIAERQHDEAVASLRTGYAMARHVAEQPFFVCGLVAWSIEGAMSLQLRDLIAQPGVPNMYWAIAALPHPLIDVRHSIQTETAAMYQMVPEMEPSKRRDLSPDQWTALAPQALSDVFELHQRSSPAPTPAEREAFVNEALKAAPQAKADLIAAGHPKEEVEAMVPAEAVLLDVFEIYEGRRDDLVKQLNLPYWLACEGMKDAESQIAGSSKSPALVSLAETLVPLVPAAAVAEAWHQRGLAILRCVEAIRLYAATHEGQLPPSLDSIREVPIPIDPVTGKAFDYRLEGDVAVIEAEPPAHYPPRRYRLSVVDY